MKLKIQKRLAADVLKRSPKKIKFDSSRLEEVKEAITKVDIKSLIKDKAITGIKKVGPSRGRTRKAAEQKAKGKRKSHGSRKGKATARLSKKEKWMTHVRKQRELLKNMKEKGIISKEVYRNLYCKSKGGYFRSVRHIKLYINEKGLTQDKQKQS